MDHHRTMEELQGALEHIGSSPIGHGRLALIVSRPGRGERAVLDIGELDLAAGLVGDSWNRRPSRRTPDRSPHPDMQLNLMNVRAVAAIAGSPERWPLAGDQLYVDLHLGGEQLPPGSRLAIGDAVIEITAIPHRGCAKFTARFGMEAMRFVNSGVGRAMNLRGVNARVIVPGTIRPGDEISAVGALATTGP